MISTSKQTKREIMIRVENADCRSKIIASRAVPEATNATHSRQSPHSVRISSARRPPGCRERSTPPRRWLRGSALRLPCLSVGFSASAAPHRRQSRRRRSPPFRPPPRQLRLTDSTFGPHPARVASSPDRHAR